MKIGLIGLGQLGSVVASNLHQAGLLDIVYNRTSTKAEEFSRRFGVRRAMSIAELGQVDLIFTVLYDDSSVLEVSEELMRVMKENSILVDLSTISPSVSQNIARELSERKIEMLDAPVLGTPAVLEAKEATLAVGGPKYVFDAVKTILERITSKVFYVGTAGSGLHLKLVNNIMTASYIISLEEAVNFGLMVGLKPASIEGLFSNLAHARSPLSAGRVPKMLANDKSINKSMKNLKKDIEILESEAKKMNIPLPMTSFSARYYDVAEKFDFERSFAEISAKLNENNRNRTN